jgi:predicted TIM-barrel fold metal-dependent hydrolase
MRRGAKYDRNYAARMTDGELGGCTHALARGQRMEPLDDAEGVRVPPAEATGGPVIDAHVHLFPDALFAAVWRWFDRHLWPVRYRLFAEDAIEFLRARGVSAIVALHYAHKPGMARSLNTFVAEVARAHRDFVFPLGTVMPGEPDAESIVREALGPLGLHGIKLHCHVQKLAADDPRLDCIYQACQDAEKPVLIHAGREPCSPHYGVDTHSLCQVERVEGVLRRFPRLRVVIPHLGADEFVAYAALLDRYEHLHLDTTMAVAGFFELDAPWELVVRHAGRLLYGTDFPNVPYAWDRELRRLVDRVPAEHRGALFSGNARKLFLW